MRTLSRLAAAALLAVAAAALRADERAVPDLLPTLGSIERLDTGPGGVLVLAPDGTHLGTFLTGQATANCAFGGDGRTLYMTADSHLCRARLTTTGPLPGP